MKAILAFFGSVVGKVVGIFLVAVLIFGIWKWQWVYDRARALWWGQKVESANVHGAKGDSALRVADKDSVAAAAAQLVLDALLQRPEILTNPDAQRVGTAARTVITAKNKEIGSLRTAVAEKTAEAKDLREAGEKPVPRIQPYADIGYSVSLTKRYGVPVVRAGATYRVVSFAHLRGEVSYEPPPTIEKARRDALDAINERDFAKPEIRVTVTAHLKF